MPWPVSPSRSPGRSLLPGKVHPATDQRTIQRAKLRGSVDCIPTEWGHPIFTAIKVPTPTGFQRIMLARYRLQRTKKWPRAKSHHIFYLFKSLSLNWVWRKKTNIPRRGSTRKLIVFRNICLRFLTNSGVNLASSSNTSMQSLAISGFQNLFDLLNSGLNVVKVLVFCSVNRSRDDRSTQGEN